MSELAVVIVTWNVRDLALGALQSLCDDLDAHGPSSTDVHLVDNASEDGTAEAIASAFPQVKLTASSENLGFGAGNNLALRTIGFGRLPSDQLPRAGGHGAAGS